MNTPEEWMNKKKEFSRKEHLSFMIKFIVWEFLIILGWGGLYLISVHNFNLKQLFIYNFLMLSLILFSVFLGFFIAYVLRKERSTWK